MDTEKHETLSQIFQSFMKLHFIIISTMCSAYSLEHSRKHLLAIVMTRWRPGFTYFQLNVLSERMKHKGIFVMKRGRGDGAYKHLTVMFTAIIL